MKCQNCGAEIGDNKFCQFCGTQVSAEMRREQEILNKKGCPKCGSSNIQFNRENQGEVRGKNNKRIVHKTVGFCKDCGYTWYPSNTSGSKQNDSMIWWVLGWIFFFPAPLMVLIWRKKNTWDIKIKIGITVAFWLVFLIIGISGNKDKTNSVGTSSATEEAMIESTKEINNTSSEEVKMENTDIEEASKEDTTDDAKEEKASNAETSEINNRQESVDFISEHENDIVAAASLALDNYIDKNSYKMSLAPQKWTIAKFDETETTVIAMTDITYNGQQGKYIYVGTLNMDDSGKTKSATPHYLEVNGVVLGNDGYCDDVFDKIKSLE